MDRLKENGTVYVKGQLQVITIRKYIMYYRYTQVNFYQ